jgi:hypothetical protein
VEYEKDVMLLVQRTIKSSLKCARPADRDKAILGQVSRAVSYCDLEHLPQALQGLFQPHLEYVVVSGSLWTEEYKETFKRVQRRGDALPRRQEGEERHDSKVNNVDHSNFFSLVTEGAGRGGRKVL